MTRRSRIWSTLAFCALFAAFLLVTGPWESSDEQAYRNLAANSTKVVLRRSSALVPDAVGNCMEGIPPSLLNLARLRAGPGITLANPVQRLLIVIEAREGGSHVTVFRPPDRSLRLMYRDALLRCTG